MQYAQSIFTNVSVIFIVFVFIFALPNNANNCIAYDLWTFESVLFHSPALALACYDLSLFTPRLGTCVCNLFYRHGGHIGALERNDTNYNQMFLFRCVWVCVSVSLPTCNCSNSFQTDGIRNVCNFVAVPVYIYLKPDFVHTIVRKLKNFQIKIYFLCFLLFTENVYQCNFFLLRTLSSRWRISWLICSPLFIVHTNEEKKVIKTLALCECI